MIKMTNKSNGSHTMLTQDQVRQMLKITHGSNLVAVNNALLRLNQGETVAMDLRHWAGDTHMIELVKVDSTPAAN